MIAGRKSGFSFPLDLYFLPLFASHTEFESYEMMNFVKVVKVYKNFCIGFFRFFTIILLEKSFEQGLRKCISTHRSSSTQCISVARWPHEICLPVNVMDWSSAGADEST